MHSSFQCDDESRDASHQEDSSTQLTALDYTTPSTALSRQYGSSAGESYQVVVQPLASRQRNRPPRDEKKTMRAIAMKRCYEQYVFKS